MAKAKAPKRRRTPSLPKQAKRPKYNPSGKPSFRNPFGFLMDEKTMKNIFNRKVLATALNNYRGWLPQVNYANGKMVTCAKRFYLARSSAVMAAELYIRHVRGLYGRTPAAMPVEVQLEFAFTSPEMPMLLHVA